MYGQEGEDDHVSPVAVEEKPSKLITRLKGQCDAYVLFTKPFKYFCIHT